MLKPILYRMMDRSEHGELLLLFGLFAALVAGAGGFELVGLKADLGALVLGVLLAGHTKSSELSKTLLGLKDLLLVGFFLTIGLSGVPDAPAIVIAALLVVAMPFKAGLFYVLLTRFRLRARSSLLGSLSLASYSEFGLIVTAVGVSNGWLSQEWLVIIALALSATFVIAAPLNTMADVIYIRYREKLRRFETDTRHPDDQPIDPAEAIVGVFGMGRIGTKVYDFMREKYGETVIGFDFNAKRVKKHNAAGRRVLFGDPTDPDFWQRLENLNRQSRIMAILTMSKHRANMAAVKHLADINFHGQIAAVARFDDQVEALRAAGVHAAFNFYNEAGLGFAKHAWEMFEGQQKQDPGIEKP